MHSADKAFIAETTARMLLEVKAVLFFQDKPFIFTSGWASPVYIDCRKLIFYPRIRTQLVDFATATLSRDAGFEQFDVVAGGETAGIPYAAWIADRLGLPMQYVRKKPKGFGRNAQIEGDVREGARTLLVEDLTTDGRSKINFCQALRGEPAEQPLLRRRPDAVDVESYYSQEDGKEDTPPWAADHFAGACRNFSTSAICAACR